MAKLIGFGAMNLCSVRSLPGKAIEYISINTNGYVSSEKQKNIPVMLREEYQEVLPIQWPMFHSGVATGLKLVKRNLLFDEKYRDCRNLKMFRRSSIHAFLD